MELRFAIVCDNAFTDNEGRLSIIQTFDRISSPGFPAIHPRVSIVTNYGFETGDNKAQTYTQILRIINPRDGKEIFSGERAIKPAAGRDNFIQYIARIVGFSFPNEGKYEIQTQLNDKDFGTIATINVAKESN